jgi:glycosyltransferase involved in cell wall biosynthesis
MPVVSVIIPSYNHQQYIREAVQSVLNQSFTDLEVVIVDDGSKDKTVAEIKKIKDPRVRLFTFRQNKGACTAANFALSKARGKFIAMLSSDDVFESNKLAKQVEYLRKHPQVGAVFSRATIINQQSQPFKKKHFYQTIFDQPNRTQTEWLRFFFYNANCLCHPSALIRRKVYTKIGEYDPRFAQLPDLHFWIRLVKKFPIHIMSDRLIRFRVHDTNVSGDTSKTHARHQIEMVWVLNEFLQLKPEQVMEAFPETSQLAKSAIFTPYAIATQALQMASPSHLLFGLQTLYELLTTKPTVLAEVYGLDYVKFNQLTAEKNIFNIASKEKEHMRSLIAKSNYIEYETAIMRKSLFYTLWKIWHKISSKTQ